jgi:hypothetical protein
MTISLAQASLLTQDVMMKGIIETIINESMFLEMLPFMEINGTALTYNRELAAATIQWHTAYDTWVENQATVEQITVPLKIIGGDADVDKFLQQSFNNPNDLKAEMVSLKAKALAYEFTRSAYLGDGTGNQLVGLNSLVTAPQTIPNTPNGATPTLDMLDLLIDLVKPGKPDALIMSKRSRRSLKKLFRTSGNAFVPDVNRFGRRVLVYDDIPIIVDDNIPDNLTVGTSTNCSVIFAVQFGYGRGIFGVSNGMIQYEEVGPLETANSHRTRVKMYGNMAMTRSLGLAAIKGVLPI